MLLDPNNPLVWTQLIKLSLEHIPLGFTVHNIELNLGRVLTIQPEVLYTVKGADSGTGKLKFDYIEIPILLKVRIPQPLNMSLRRSRSI